MRSNEQKLIDIMFDMALTISENSQWFDNKTNEEICEWVRNQLANNGFYTEPIGGSWGVLTYAK